MQVQLSERLMSNIIFKKVSIQGSRFILCCLYLILPNDFDVNIQLGENEIAWFDSDVGKAEDEMLSLLPCSTPAPPHKPILVGDLKMANFKQFLADNGVQVLFFAISQLVPGIRNVTNDFNRMLLNPDLRLRSWKLVLRSYLIR